MTRILILLVLLGGLAGCASLSENECRAGDWQAIGYEDGTNGKLPSHIARHREACAEYGIAPDPALWEQGRTRGLVEYCTPLRAWHEGADGHRLSPVCPVEMTRRLERENYRGRVYYDLGREIARAEKDIDTINRFLAANPDDPARSALIGERASLRLEILRLRAERIRYKF